MLREKIEGLVKNESQDPFCLIKTCLYCLLGCKGPLQTSFAPVFFSQSTSFPITIFFITLLTTVSLRLLFVEGTLITLATYLLIRCNDDKGFTLTPYHVIGVRLPALLTVEEEKTQISHREENSFERIRIMKFLKLKADRRKAIFFCCKFFMLKMC